MIFSTCVVLGFNMVGYRELGEAFFAEAVDMQC